MYLLVAAALIAGCATSLQPFDYHDDRDEKPGPGLFSGEEGGFVIHGGDVDNPPEKETAAAANAQSEKDPP